MSKQTLEYLKSRFEMGDKPSQDDFYDLIDTLDNGNILDGLNELLATGGVLVNPSIKNYTESVNSVSGTTLNVDLSLGTIHVLTTTGNATVTLPTPTVGKVYLVIINYGGAHTVTFTGGTSIKWVNGIAPTATAVSGKKDLYLFASYNSSETLAQDGGRNM